MGSDNPPYFHRDHPSVSLLRSLLPVYLAYSVACLSSIMRTVLLWQKIRLFLVALFLCFAFGTLTCVLCLLCSHLTSCLPAVFVFGGHYCI